MSSTVERAALQDALIGIWTVEDGAEIIDLLFRPSGRYQQDTTNTDPISGSFLTERGRYEIDRQVLTLLPYDLVEGPGKQYELELSGNALTVTTLAFPQVRVYQLKPGSRADVLAREKVEPVLFGTWWHEILFWGKKEYTFRPGGYYVLENLNEGGPHEFIRGRYTRDNNRVTLTPYSGTPVEYEVDFFGNTLTLIRKEESVAEGIIMEAVAGSAADVQAKATEAQAFTSREHWLAGVWEIRNEFHKIDLTIRPDGRYIAQDDTDEFLRGVVRGRYRREAERLHFMPFLGQDMYAPRSSEFNQTERTVAIDYYDGELQLIDLGSFHWVTLARKRAGSEAAILEKTRQAQTAREREGWYLGIWEVNDPSGWMEFTFRPDNRYIAKAGGSERVAHQVERGRFLFAGEKLTLAPYSGLRHGGQARGFDLDYYDGDLFVIGDSQRMAIARKLDGSEAGVIEKTRDPEAMKGERGTILGLWSADLPGESAALVFRPDGEFRLNRCANNALSHDYGLYTADMGTRTLVMDSRLVMVQTHGLDFYGNTMTIFGGLGPPDTYTVNLGGVDAALNASIAADAAEARIDAQWLARVPVAPRDPDFVSMPTADIPADPNPGRVFTDATVFKNFQLYRRLIPGFVFFNVLGTIRSVVVTHTRAWFFFPNGRVLVQFRNFRAGAFYPTTVADVSNSWGAYRIEPKPPDARDILHFYADNVLFIETDLGERTEMTLEDGRRNLFWNKDAQLLSEWAAEQKTIPCQPPANPDPNLSNTGISLSSAIKPDEIAPAPATHAGKDGVRV
jgi:hypothetical protein